MFSPHPHNNSNSIHLCDTWPSLQYIIQVTAFLQGREILKSGVSLRDYQVWGNSVRSKILSVFGKRRGKPVTSNYKQKFLSLRYYGNHAG